MSKEPLAATVAAARHADARGRSVEAASRPRVTMTPGNQLAHDLNGTGPLLVATAVRGEGFADFVRTVFASLYGELDPVLVADIERRRTLDQDVFSGFWTPLLDWDADTLAEQAPKRTHYPHLAQPEWFVSRVHKFFSLDRS